MMLSTSELCFKGKFFLSARKPISILRKIEHVKFSDLSFPALPGGRLYNLAGWLMLLCQLTAFRAVAQLSASRPNIVMIVGDDMRYDSFEPTGGPLWLAAPSINRIADEGVNFQYYFCVFSLCTPARSSMMTGLYAHSNGSVDGETPYYPYLPTIASILDTAGYHTAMVGKYGVYFVPQPGWDYWMGRTKVAHGDYTDQTFNVNGVIKKIDGNVTQVINDTSYKIIAEIDTPFFVYVGHQAPHQPAVALQVSEGIYGNQQMPVPSNFEAYDNHYPSFLYDNIPPLTENVLKDDLENYYECITDIDRNVEDIFNALTARNLLDNTLFLFTADNGYLYGEHNLKGKDLPYDPSIRLPMFIRYPAWFTSNTIVDGPMGLNTDIVPTLLEAAGIDATPYHFQGVSLNQLANGTLQRDMFYYENIKYTDVAGGILPSMRTIRSKAYKYNWYQCSEQTEEFFNLQNDPDENYNLIASPAYAGLVNTYRHLLDSMRIATHDTLSADSVIQPCHLVKNRQVDEVVVLENTLPIYEIANNPFKERMMVRLNDVEAGPVQLALYNQIGQLISAQTTTIIEGKTSTLYFDTVDLSSGIYFLHAIQQGRRQGEFVVRE